MILWAVYSRQRIDQPWRLVFTVPSTVSETTMEQGILAYERIDDIGRKRYWMLLRIDESEIMVTLTEGQEPYRG